jgi:hypothetical protein
LPSVSEVLEAFVLYAVVVPIAAFSIIALLIILTG